MLFGPHGWDKTMKGEDKLSGDTYTPMEGAVMTQENQHNWSFSEFSFFLNTCQTQTR